MELYFFRIDMARLVGQSSAEEDEFELAHVQSRRPRSLLHARIRPLHV